MQSTDNRTRAYAIKRRVGPKGSFAQYQQPFEVAFLRDPTPEKIAEVLKQYPDALDLTPTPMANALWVAVGRINGHLYPF